MIGNLAKAAATVVLSDVLVRAREKGWQDPCIAAVMPGLEVPFDYCGGQCDGGMVWTRVALVAPIASQDAAGRPCVTGWDMQLEVGIIHKAPWPEGDSPDEWTLPTSTEHTHATEVQVEAMDIMLAAIQCQTFGGGKATPLTYSPIGPEGGCVGGVWLFSVPLV